MQEVQGNHAPSFLFFAKPAIQDPNIQPAVLFAKIKGQQCLFFNFLTIYELLGYISWFVVSKSLCIEMFHSLLSVMFS